jgi:hypothetical protein
MALHRTIICSAGIFIAVGFAATQAGGQPEECQLEIEVNALRGGSPTVTVCEIGCTKDITAKARIAKGTALRGTTIETTLRIEAKDGEDVFQTKTFAPVHLEVGKGGQGQKLTMDITQCNSGSIDFIATFFGNDADDNECEVDRTINKTCK